MQCLNRAAISRKEDRVEWMYQGGFAAQEDADKRKEEYLLGKAVERLPDQGKEEPQARVCPHPLFCAVCRCIAQCSLTLVLFRYSPGHYDRCLCRWTKSQQEQHQGAVGSTFRIMKRGIG